MPGAPDHHHCSPLSPPEHKVGPCVFLHWHWLQEMGSRDLTAALELLHSLPSAFPPAAQCHDVPFP